MLRQRGKSSKTPASGQKRTATKVPSPKPRLTALNLETALKRIQQRTNQSNAKSDLDLVGVAIGCTTDHDNLRSDTIRNCVVCLQADPDKKFDEFLKTDPIMTPNGTVNHVPCFLSALGGKKTATKQQLVNHILTYWQSVTKKKQPGQGKEQFFAWYQPVTQSQRLRTFFAHCNKEFGWEWTINDFKKRHMLAPFMEKLYEERLKTYGHVRYGQANRKRRLTDADIA